MKFSKASLVIAGALVVAAIVAPEHAFAAGTGGTWPWDSTLTKLIQELTGPIPFIIGIIAFLGAGATLIMARGEIGGFFTTMLYIILVVSLLLNIVNIMSMIGGAGAVV